MTANWFANFAIFAWPLVAICLYLLLPFSEATLYNILGALLLLPSSVSIKLEMIPAFDKSSIPNLCALIGCVLYAPRYRRVASGFWLVELLAATYILSPVLTSALNNDAIIIG